MKSLTIHEVLDLTPESRTAVIKQLSKKDAQIPSNQCRVYMDVVTDLEKIVDYNTLKKLEIIYSQLFDLYKVA